MNTPTLDAVQADFQRWRQHRPYLRSPAPTELRDKALLLRERHSTAAICKALGITRRMLQNWQGQTAGSEPERPEPIEFVVLPPAADATHQGTRDLQLSLTQASGDQWCLRGDPSVDQLHAFVAALAGGGR